MTFVSGCHAQRLLKQIAAGSVVRCAEKSITNHRFPRLVCSTFGRSEYMRVLIACGKIYAHSDIQRHAFPAMNLEQFKPLTEKLHFFIVK